MPLIPSHLELRPLGDITHVEVGTSSRESFDRADLVASGCLEKWRFSVAVERVRICTTHQQLGHTKRMPPLPQRNGEVYV